MERFLTRRVSSFGQWAMRMAAAVLSRLSPGQRRAMSFGLGRLAFALGIRRRIALDNLRQAFPEKTKGACRRIARASYGHMFLSALEGLCGRVLEGSTRLSFEGWERIEGHLEGGEGLLIASAHFGSWELMAELMAARGRPIAAVVRPLGGAINARLFEARQESGMELIHPKGAVRGMVKAWQRKKLVVQLIDQSIAADRALFVPFFGRMTATAPALSMAALHTKAPVYLALSERTPEGMRIWIEGPFEAVSTGEKAADLRRHLEALSAALEGHIRRCPEQWMWMHRRWKVPYTPPVI